MLKTHGVSLAVYIMLALTMAFSIGDAAGNFVDRENAYDAFHKACAMNSGTVVDEDICVVNGKAVLFN
jgi:hypothetical protein